MVLRSPIGAALAAVTILTPVLTPAPALAQQSHVDEANALYRDIVPARRSEGVLIPALAALEAPPASAADPDDVPLLETDSPSWPAVEAWAMAGPQRAALAALAGVTANAAYVDAMNFAQPYGAAGLPVDVLRSGLYTDLGDPPLLAAAKFGVLPALDRLRSLVHVEATRLTAAGSVTEAVELLLRLAVLGRQMADREFIVEAHWGYIAMIDALGRVRDVVYADFQGERRADPEALGVLIPWLARDGALATDRLEFPDADRIAADQIIATVYEPRGKVKPEVFIQTMSRLASSGRPLRRFAAAGRWARAAGTQEDWFTVTQALVVVHAGWTQRWTLDPDSPVLKLPFPYDDYADEARFASLSVPLLPRGPGGEPVRGETLFGLRTTLDVERVGTVLSLGIVARYYAQNQFPPQLAGVRPRWVKQIEPDGFASASSNTGARPVMQFFVPVRDSFLATERDEKKPHFMQVFAGDGTNFGVELFEDQFVLYSVGPNARDDDAAQVSRDPESLVGDYLLWPPVQGLYRKHLRENNASK